MDLMELLRQWALGFCPLNAIERAVSDLIDARGSNSAQRTAGVSDGSGRDGDARTGDIPIDCTGSRSLLRDHLLPGSGDAGRREHGQHPARIRARRHLLYGQLYACTEYCKYNNNIENVLYKFIPAVHRTYYDGSITHVTGIVKITAEEYAAMPSRFDGPWLQHNFPSVAESIDRFIDKIKQESHGELLGNLEVIRIPLNLYRARNATNRQWRNCSATTRSPTRRCSWSAIRLSALRIQSISLGLSVRCSGGTNRAVRDCHSETCSIDMSSTSTSSGLSTCAAR